jgi:MoaA/NifB/PqqE/SkfB family radical SAM enzyme
MTALTRRIKSLLHLYSGKLDTLILFVTTRCNCKCEHCFYWRQLQEGKDLSLGNIKKIAQTSGKFRTLMISGGEPFLRNDLVEIAKYFSHYAGIENFAIPTNGVKTDIIVDCVHSICRQINETQIKINLSLDGPEKIHDKIRGRKGVHRKAINTLNELLKLKSAVSNLEVNITSVVCQANISVIQEFVEHMKKYKIDNHNVEIIRGEAKNPEYNLNREKLIQVYLDTLKCAESSSAVNQTGYLHHIGSGKKLIEAEIKKNNILHSSNWPVACSAGKSICVVEPNGDMRACELRSCIANISSFDYSLKALMNSSEMQIERNQIKKDECFCTHGCFLSVSLQKSPIHTFIKSPIKSIFSSKK